MEKYFDKFPLITYANSVVVDITKRVKVLDRVSSNPYAFYPFDIGNSERADSLSFRYYDDSFMSWLLYISNDIVDPYYEWYLTQDELEEYITKQYGSLSDSKLKVKHYRNDWENAEPISVSAYNALNDEQKHYWQAEYRNGAVYRYNRKKEDFKASTNKIVSYAVSNTSFTADEICDIVFSTGVAGRAQVIQSSNNNLYVQHITGNYDETVTANSYVYGRTSGVNTAITEVSSVTNCISSSVLSYYTPITYYDYEYEKNEFNRTIRVIDKDLKYVASDNLRNLMSE